MGVRTIAQDCDGEGPCQSVFDNVMQVQHHLNVDNAKHVEEFLRQRYGGRLPIDSTNSTLKQVFDRQPFDCPELSIKVRQPCRVRSCAYWTNHAWTRNCILFYRVDQGRVGLDLKELIFLLDQTATELRKRTNSILAEMRRWALRNKTQDRVEDAPELIEPLSERELEILRSLVSELPVPEIAGRYHIAVSTLRTHIRNIYAKLGVHSRFEAVTRAKELKLL